MSRNKIQEGLIGYIIFTIILVLGILFAFGKRVENDYQQSQETTTTTIDTTTTSLTTTTTMALTTTPSTSTSITTTTTENTSITETTITLATTTTTTTETTTTTAAIITTTATTTTTTFNETTTTIITTTSNFNFVKTFSRGTFYAYGCPKKGGSGRDLIDCSVGDGDIKGSIASRYLYEKYGYLYNGERSKFYLEIEGYEQMNGYYYLDDSSAPGNDEVIDFFYIHECNCPFMTQGVVKVNCYI